MTLTVTPNGPKKITFWNSLFDEVSLVLQTNCEVRIVGSALAAVRVRGVGQVVLDGCIYDPANCEFPTERVQGLDSCEAVPLAESMYKAYALLEVLRRLVTAIDPQNPGRTRKKAIAEDDVHRGLVRNYEDVARQIIRIMITRGYVQRRPTGGIWLIDPTTTFDACEATKFITRPGPNC